MPALNGFYDLSEEQVKSWKDNGYLILRDLFTPEEVKMIIQATTDISNMPETPGKWMHYYEKGGKLCRTENFIPFHTELRELVSGKKMLDVLHKLMGEECILFKEKINYKLPGGGAFPPHQDAPAYVSFNQKIHVTCNIAVDQSTIANGCLQAAPGRHREGLFAQNGDGTISHEACKTFNWVPILLNPGDVLVFDSYIPHYSDPNTSDHSRRSIYVTYNGKSDGDFREAYYVEKRKHFPQRCERVEGVDYSEGGRVYNLATPIEM
eukprot:Colp12_sorted_trinity150504_noHs@14532